MLMDVNGLPFSVPDPATEELLPVNDIDWDMGKAVASESLYTSSFSNNTVLGPFAMLCQASNILSKIQQHRMRKKSSSEPLEELVKEALHLDRISSALQVSIQDCCKELSDETSPFISALAVCCAARFCLYSMYACHTSFGRGISTPLQTDMQHLSLEGISGLVQITLPPLARLRYGCPFLGHCLYYAATEAAWLVREGSSVEVMPHLKDILNGLQYLQSLFDVSGRFADLMLRSNILMFWIQRSFDISITTRGNIDARRGIRDDYGGTYV